MAHFPKPAEGSWTEHYPELGTGPVDYEDSISPEFYELERKAIFNRTWLNVGRVEQVPRTGRYFTKELQCAGTSVVIVRDKDGGVRGFHNICRHRGNKLVWNDFPNEETSGTCRQFTCKYHGWRYDLDGSLTFVQQESEFFDLDKDDYGLAPVQTEVWEGFIFVNLDPDNTTSVKEYLGDLGAGLEGYPFGEMTQVYKYRANVGSNWKLFIDAFAEFYHAPVLHAKQATDDESRKLQGYGFEALSYAIDGPHGMVSSWGGMAPPKDPSMVKPIENVLRSGLFGPWDRPDIAGLDPLPACGQPGALARTGASTPSSSSPTSCCWCGRRAGTSRTTTGRPPTTRTSSRGRSTSCPRRTPPSGSARSWPRSPSRSTPSRTANTLEATQTMIESRAVTEFPLNDQEILLRHLHRTARGYVADYEKSGTPVDAPGRALSEEPR